MRITIETTDTQPRCAYKVSCEFPGDDCSADSIIRTIKQLLIGSGFSAQTIEGCLPEENLGE